MKRVSLASIDAVADSRLPGYREAVIAAASRIEGGYVHLDDDSYTLLRHRFARPGLGDMVKAGLSAIGITEDRVSKAIGRPCGCAQRAERLNELGRKFGIG